MEFIGWASTALVLIGYFFNANQNRVAAFTTWIVGDIGWIVYDIYIDNLSHLVLSSAIISLNIYGIIKKSYGTKRVSESSKENKCTDA